jgi:hypothetical protein
MKLVVCEQNSEEIKHFFDKINTRSIMEPVSKNARSFGNTYGKPRYLIPISKSSSHNFISKKKAIDVNIVSPAEAATDQAKAEIKQKHIKPKIVPIIESDTIVATVSSSTHSRKRKRQDTSEARKSTPTKKQKRGKKIF